MTSERQSPQSSPYDVEARGRRIPFRVGAKIVLIHAVRT
jgi:hypothetical protein